MQIAKVILSKKRETLQTSLANVYRVQESILSKEVFAL
jgi:hypothetical protein